MTRIRHKICLFVLLLSQAIASAQQTTPLINSTLDGVVVDAITKEPLAEATIQIEGVTHSTKTDDHGKFQFVTGQRFPYTSIVSYIGYKTKTVVATGSPIIIELERNHSAIDEIEVVGYTKTKRSALTSAIQVVKGEDLSQAPYTSIVEKLQGQVPGLLITNDSGTPGTSVLVRLRGTNSITGGSDPLYIVDDVIINSDNLQGTNLGGQLVNPLSDISPTDIESITVLKDANATAIYGSRGANGVILIKTNRGRAQARPRVNFGLQTGTSTTRNLWELVTGEEHATIVNEAFVNSGGLYENRPFRPVEEATAAFPAWGLPEEQQTYDRLGSIWRTAISQRYNLSIAGGGASSNFYIGGEYLDQPSTVKAQDFSRYTFRVNLDYKINDRFKIGTSNNLSATPRKLIRVGDGGTGLFQAALHTPTFFPIIDSDGQYTTHFTFDNVLAMLENTDTRSNSLRTVNNVFGELKVFPSLTFKSSWSVDYNIYKEDTYFNTKLRTGLPAGAAEYRNTERATFTADQLLNYNKSFASNDLAVFLGTSYQYTDKAGQVITGSQFPSDQHRTIASAGVRNGTTTASSNALLSYFGGVNFSYKERYVIDGTFRADGSSRIGKDHRWGYFPAAGVNWRISNEPFFPKSDIINELRLKASWGLTGNASVGDFQSLGLWEGNQNYGDLAGIAPSQMANADLRWETTAQWNVGLSGILFKQRLDFEISYYDKYTKDLLLNSFPVQDITGFSAITYNAGEISNQGVELIVNSENLNNKDLSWRTTYTISRNTNKVEKLLQPITGGYRQFRLEEGHPISSIWVHKQLGVDPQTGNVIYEDVDGDGQITQADRQLLGSVWPDFEGGLRNSLSYKRFDLNVNITYRWGNRLYNYTKYFLESGGVRSTERAMQKSQLNYWKKPGDTNVLPRLSSATNPDGSRNYEPASANSYSSRFLEDASFLRVKDITLGYSLPSQWVRSVGFAGAKATFTAANLITLTKYSGPDPEANSQTNRDFVLGMDFNTVPQPVSFLFGINANL
ncbi:SusC/RagA family TonB-linked outer membrane protein [Parapedobacter sp. 2B3]|uniref:SusC/RagA family TonB-linked outer membrane protein n=1 Tax=Parapedobacter sp. 2B3 TaxID=3342381 RepID=UPI0035B6A3AA